MKSMNVTDTLSKPLTLPCGVVIKNRFMKSAMSEILGTATHAPSEGHCQLYGAWADGGLGLSVTGNVMVDRRALGEPANVVLEDDRDMSALRNWAQAGSRGGTGLWMQLNHPGKQVLKFLSKEPVAPSAIGFKSDIKTLFEVPRALREDEIEDLIKRFGRSAALAVEAGFQGIQIHGAHGYLVSQFLSPKHNQRTDRWGGSLENRMRFPMEVYREIRKRVGDAVPVGIKINSADFDRGGFSEEDSMVVIQNFSEEGMDLIEVSGGNYEAPAMIGAVKASTQRREAYFLSFAETIRKKINTPLAVTGGFRTHEGMATAIESGAVDMIGLARPLAIDTELPNRILAGEAYESPVKRLTTGNDKVDRFAMLEVTWYENQLARIASGKAPKPHMNPWMSILTSLTRNGLQSFKMRRAK